jgi:hypothetical protein
MPKFYVESGPMFDVVDAKDGMEACVKTVLRAATSGKSPKSARIFTVNEKGFLRNKDVVDTSGLMSYDAKEILRQLRG